MQPARRELYDLAGIDGEAAFDRAHLHHAALRGHLMHLDLPCGFRTDADKLVRRAALVLDGEEAAADLGAARRCAGPGLRDHEIAGLDVVGARGRCETNEDGSTEDPARDQGAGRLFGLHSDAPFLLFHCTKWAAGCSVPSTPTKAKTSRTSTISATVL